jgi:DNA-binding HxlR family transcriptional regulator
VDSILSQLGTFLAGTYLEVTNGKIWNYGSSEFGMRNDFRQRMCIGERMITSLANKWSLWTMSVLASAGTPLRFSRAMELVEGISQKSLTKTLRQLERDGLVKRKIFAEAPPRVEFPACRQSGSQTKRNASMKTNQQRLSL